MRPKLGVGSEVIDLLASANRLADGRTIANISGDKVDLLEWQMIDLRSGSIKHADTMAVIEQLLNQVAANEASAAGDKNRFQD